MAHPIDERLAALNITLPQAAAPAANYVPYTIANGLLYTSGQLPLDGGSLTATGQVGGSVDVETAQSAARQCAINVLAQAKTGVDGDWSRIKRLIKLTVFVSSTSSFTEQHKVANGASDFLVEVLGEPGRHARSAVGVAALPLDASVEVEALFELA